MPLAQAREASAVAKRAASDQLRSETIKLAKATQMPCGRYAKGKCAKLGPNSPGRIVCGFPHNKASIDTIPCISATIPKTEWPEGRSPCEFDLWPGMRCPYLNHVSSDAVGQCAAVLAV